ncbi:hypothetical protein FMM05_00595 [Flavobacterium zepuense]|uniref:Uncharacterized protein n=1 Tax=Flavobacterium zepuense TaxID=2593302 RepID=A0A552V9N3_9FLAO|nr:hypothetical protein [Flavobacterium zepuense]TRW27175.1 hypothetical protein FMM05_00595 [Flavobacterium zepuense]
MSKIKNLLAGLGGAIVLNIIHESLKKKGPDMPRVDLVGEEALQKSLNYLGTSIDDDATLYKVTLAGDVISNALYYSLIGGGSYKHIWTWAVFYGLSGGIGAVTLPEPAGLDPEPVNKAQKTKVLTVAYYLAGALVTGAILKAVVKKDE